MFLLGNVFFFNKAQAYSSVNKNIMLGYMDGGDSAYWEEYEQGEQKDYAPESTLAPVTEVVSDFTATVEDAVKVKLRWTVDDTYYNEITHFEIYRSTQRGERGILLKTIENTDELFMVEHFDKEDGSSIGIWKEDYAEYIDTDVTMGVTYYYTIRGVISHNGLMSYGPFCDEVSVCVTLGTPSVSIKAVDEHTAMVSFEEVTGAEYYEIERSETDTEHFSVVAEIPAESNLSYTDSSLVLGKHYYYRVRAYCNVDDNRIYSEYCSVKKITPILCAPVIKSAKVKNAATMVISFGKVTKAQGYCLYKKNTKTGKFKLVQTVKGNANTKFTIQKLKNGVEYTYKIAAYRTVNGKRLYGTLSKKKSKIMDYYGYETESWESRYKRIFRKSGKYWYASEKEASKNMTTIQIKVWDISGGKKSLVQNT